MKIKFSTLVAGVLVGMLCIAPGCSRIDELDSKVSDLEKRVDNIDKQLPTIQEQITMLNDLKTQLESGNILTTIQDLQSKMNQLSGKVDGVDGKLNGLQETVTGFAAQAEKTLGEAVANLQKQISALKDAQEKLASAQEGDAKALEEYKKATDATLDVIAQILDGWVENWTVGGEMMTIDYVINAIYSLMIQYLSEVDGDSRDRDMQLIGYINELYGYCGELEDAIGELKLNAEDYLTKTAFEQYQQNVEARLEAIGEKLYLDSVAFAEGIKGNKEKVDEIINTTIPGLDERISDLETIFGELEGSIDELIENTKKLGELPEDQTTFAAWIAKNEAGIAALKDQIEIIEGRLVNVEDLLKNRIQSIVFVPEYDDCRLSVSTVTLKAENDTLDPVEFPVVGEEGIVAINKYRVSPATLADTIVKAFKAEALKVAYDAVPVKTRGQKEIDTLKLDIRNIEAEDGIITVTAAVAEAIDSIDIVMNVAALVLSDIKGNVRSTEYTLCASDEAMIELVADAAAANDTTIISKTYADDSDATFFTPDGNDFKALFSVNGKDPITAEVLKTTMGIDIADYIVDTTFSVKPNEVVNVINNGEAVVVNNISDAKKAQMGVGDTTKVYKAFGIQDPKTGRNIWMNKPYYGEFKVTNIQNMTAEMTAGVNWNMDENLLGDAGLGYKNKNINVTIADIDGIFANTIYCIDSLSHKVPSAYTVTKVKKNGQESVLANKELADFKIAPSMNKKAKTMALDSIAGFQFDNISKYIVEAKYPVGGKAGFEDTLVAKLTINLTDRSRDTLRHTFNAVDITVTKDFGGKLSYYLHKGASCTGTLDGEWEYWNDAIALYQCGTEADFYKYYPSYTGVLSRSTKPMAKRPNIYFTTAPEDSIVVTYPYTFEDIDKSNTSGFTIKDTLATGYNQIMIIECPVNLIWPAYDFKHSEYFVSKDSNNDYYSMVKPNYKGADGKYNYIELYSYDVQAVDMARNFNVVDPQGNLVPEANYSDLGLSVSYEFNGDHGNITLDPATGIINYQDSLATVGVKAILKINVKGEDYPLPTKFDTGKDYAGYYIKKYEPFSSFTGATDAASTEIICKEFTDYKVELRKLFSLIDNRAEVHGAGTNWPLIVDGEWVRGNMSNGFFDVLATEAYGITEKMGVDTTGITDPAIKKLLTYDLNVSEADSKPSITFKYDGQTFLVKDIEIPVTDTISTVWGKMVARSKVVFKKER